MTQAGLLKLGGDPRRTREFAQLRQALAPLVHPACPDVDWQQVRACAQALVKVHGAELQGLRALALAHAWCAEPQAAANVIRGVAQLLVEHAASLWPSETGQRQVLIDEWCQHWLAWSRHASREDIRVLSSALATLRQALEVALLVSPQSLQTLLARSERRFVPITAQPSVGPFALQVAAPCKSTPQRTHARGLLRTFAGVSIVCLLSVLWWQPTPAPLPLHVADLALFGAGSAALDAQAHRSLASLLGELARYPEAFIEVRGHSDDSGSPRQNHQLAEARAEAVGAWLTAQGIAPGCLQTQGLGASQPLLANATATGRAANRRVSISLIPQHPACTFTRLPATTAAPPSPGTAPPPPRPSVPVPSRQ